MLDEQSSELCTDKFSNYRPYPYAYDYSKLVKKKRKVETKSTQRVVFDKLLGVMSVKLVEIRE